MIPARGPQTVDLCNHCFAIILQSLLCIICYAVVAIFAMQPLLCNLYYLSYAIFAMQFLLIARIYTNESQEDRCP